MAKVDRLGWAAGTRLTAYGRHVGIRLSSAQPEVLERVSALLPPGARPCCSREVEHLYSVLVPSANPLRKGLKRFHIAFAGPATLLKSTEPDKVWEALETDLELYLAETARRHVFVHAAVAEWGGRAIVLPGRTFSGKTTLVAALSQAGARFYSDEYAVFDERGKVHPYPKPLSLRNADATHARRLKPEELGLTAGRKPVPVGLVLSTSYQPGARFRPCKLTPGQAALELLAQAASARTRPQGTLKALRRAVSRAAHFKGPRGEADRTAAEILEMVEQSAVGGRRSAVGSRNSILFSS